MPLAEASPTTATTASSCAAKLYNIPVQMASCAIPFTNDNTNLMSTCCGTTSVVSYFNDCGLFCLAEGQTVHELTTCLFDHGAAYSDVFCRGSENAEATGQATVAASASAHIMGHAATPTYAASSSSSHSAASRIGLTSRASFRLDGVLLVLMLFLLSLF